MITISRTNQSDNSLELTDTITEHCWIHMINPSDSEVEQVSRATGITDVMLKSALDEEETAHTDTELDNILVVVDIPSLEEENDNIVYTTMPLGIVMNEKYIVTVALRDSSLLNDFLNERVRGFNINNQAKFLLQILYRNATKFLQQLRMIDKTSHRLQAELHKSMKNKELISLLELEKSLVYFSTSLRANEVVIDKVSRFEFVRSDIANLNLLDDLIIENKQAIEMCNIYSNILSGTMDAFASIISNNVNLVMKLLTIITMILTVPTLIASFWGMNVPVPFEQNGFGFWIVVGISVVVTIVVAFVLIKRTNRLK